MRLHPCAPDLEHTLLLRRARLFDWARREQLLDRDSLILRGRQTCQVTSDEAAFVFYFDRVLFA